MRHTRGYIAKGKSRSIITSDEVYSATQEGSRGNVTKICANRGTQAAETTEAAGGRGGALTKPEVRRLPPVCPR